MSHFYLKRINTTQIKDFPKFKSSGAAYVTGNSKCVVSGHLIKRGELEDRLSIREYLRVLLVSVTWDLPIVSSVYLAGGKRGKKELFNLHKYISSS